MVVEAGQRLPLWRENLKKPRSLGNLGNLFRILRNPRNLQNLQTPQNPRTTSRMNLILCTIGKDNKTDQRSGVLFGEGKQQFSNCAWLKNSGTHERGQIHPAFGEATRKINLGCSFVSRMIMLVRGVSAFKIKSVVMCHRWRWCGMRLRFDRPRASLLLRERNDNLNLSL